MKLINHINKKASWKHVLLFLITSAILGTLIITMFFGRIDLKPEASMDSLNFYNSDVFFGNLDYQGETGRHAYLQLHLIDYLFITQFYLLFVFILSFLLRRIGSKDKTFYLCLIPIAAALFDLLENISIDFSILQYPLKHIFIGNIAGVFTFLKMALIYVTFVVIVFLLFALLIKTIKSAVKSR